MFLDHIAVFIPDMPIVFHWIGRISAPIFIFCLVNGFKHTRSKKKYIVRLYLSSVVMSIFQMFSQVELNIFRTLLTIGIIITILEKRHDNPRIFKKYLFGYCLYQLMICTLIGCVTAVSSANMESVCFYVLPAISGSVFTLEGGLIFVLLGILFYFFLDNKKYLSLVYVIFVSFNTIVNISGIIPTVLWKIRLFPIIGEALSHGMEYFLGGIIGIDVTSCGGSLLLEQYQWMMIFSLPFILLYNQKQGKKAKYFFYCFYPLHIILLWYISRT